MFDIGFGQLLLVMVIGLVVLGPKKLPIAIKTVAGWVKALRAISASVQLELSKELKLQELQESLKKAEESGLNNLTPEIQSSIDDLKRVTSSMQEAYQKEATAFSAKSDAVSETAQRTLTSDELMPNQPPSAFTSSEASHSQSTPESKDSSSS